MPGPRIAGLWAWVIDDDEGEAVVVMSPPDDPESFFPLVGSQERVSQWTSIAQHVADTTGKDVRLVQFINRIDRQTISPKDPS